LLVVTAAFRLLYVFVVIEHRSRRLIHCNVTTHPSAAWTLQQLRETIRHLLPPAPSRCAVRQLLKPSFGMSSQYGHVLARERSLAVPMAT